MSKLRRSLACLLVLMMILTLVPMNVSAATIVFKKENATVYENGKSKGVYTYTLKNVSKGQTVKWSVTGKGKKYISLKYAQKKITGKTTANKITVNTNGDMEAKNKKFTLQAQVYSKKNKLIATVKSSAKIKIGVENAVVVGDVSEQEILKTGEEYMFGVEITPLNCTDTVKWSAVDANGADVSSRISEDGEFLTTVPGNYTITASVCRGSTKKKSVDKTIVVEDAIVNAEQTRINGFKAGFSCDIGSRFEAQKMSITGSDKSTLIAKDTKMNSDGTLEVSTQTNFMDGVTYTVTYGNFSTEFVASVGAPAALQILTTQVTVDKLTPIQYALLDKQGIDVTSLYPGKIEYKPDLTNGIVDEDNRILMKTVGKSGTIHADFIPEDTKIEPLSADGTVVCVAVSVAEKNNFTITDSVAEPDYSAVSYQDQHSIYLGDVGYVHFRALDSEGDVIKYDSVTYTSSDSDALIINSSGKVTPIKAQKVTVFVLAKLNGTEYSYNYDVTITEAPILTSIQLEKDAIEVSNLANSDYKKYIKVVAFDQFGLPYELTSEGAAFVKPTAANAPVVEYETEQNRIIVKPASKQAGSYSYQLTITSGGRSVSAPFVVNVSNVPAAGTATYQVELDESAIDVALNKSTTTADQSNCIRIAKYVDNVFAGYQTFSVTSITKDGKYYGSNLTDGGSSTVQGINNVSKLALVTRRMKNVSATTCDCLKADVGTYTIDFSYYRSDLNSYMKEQVTVRILDSTAAVVANVERTTSTKTCGNALELAKDCIAVKIGEITECSVTGETNVGSKVVTVSKDAYHIKDVTITTTTEIASGIKANEVYKVSIDKTLTNN